MISIYNRYLLNKIYNINNLISLISKYSKLNKTDIITFLNKEDNELIILTDNNKTCGFILGEYIMYNTLTYKINIIYLSDEKYKEEIIKELSNYLRNQSIFKIISNKPINKEFKLLKYIGNNMMNEYNYIYEYSINY